MTDTTDDIAEEISFQSLDDDCRLLGSLLNDVLQREVGPQVMEKIEKIRILAQSALNMRTAGIEDTAEVLEKQLKSEISNMTLEDALTLARAFSHYLNLMTIAETHHRVRKARNVPFLSKSCDDIFNKLIHSGIAPEDLYDTVCKQVVEIVLTAHPTQINRRTLQYKHIRIAYLLEYNARADLSHEDRDMLIEDLVREITAIWQTDELRRHKPTPVDEARAGLHIVEQSLWRAVPRYLRRVSNALKKHTGKPLPLTCTPIKFGSWMGGDRDGNSNVTAKVTKDVSLLSRWMAIDLYIREVDSLKFELSMKKCTDSLARLAHEILQKDLAAELDVGKGIAATVASIKNSKGESALHLGYEHIVLVHYRETSELQDSPVTPVNSNSASSYSDTSVPRHLSDETDSEANHALYMGYDTSFVGESVEPSSIVSVQNHEKRLHEINTLEWEDLLLSNAPNNVNIDRRVDISSLQQQYQIANVRLQN